MEFIYLWIEDYKNIKQQGFNFSPRFTCKFFPEYEKGKNGENALKDNCKLEMKENENYVDIFPKNINITAIVGENGSGKSSILETVAQIFSKDKAKIGFTYILVFKKDKLYLDTNIKSIESKIESSKTSDGFIYLSNSFSTGYFDDLIDNFSSSNYKNYTGSQTMPIRNQSQLNQFLNSSRILESYSLEKPLYRQKHAYYINEFLNFYKNSKIILQMNYVKKLESLNIDFEIPKELSIKIGWNKNTRGIKQKKFYEYIQDIIDKNNKDINNNSDIDDENKNYIKSICATRDNFIKYIKENFSKYNASEQIVLEIDKTEKFLDLYSKIQLEIFDITWHGLSAGQDAFLSMYAYLLHGIESYYSKDESKKGKHIIIAFDEIENNFHPSWQKNIISNIINFIKQINHVLQFEYHLLYATHSPFALSDLPKENAIFLKDGKQTYPDINTFGANIHTLLSHGFFMRDGLMGNFAKDKINEIIKYLNGNKTTTISDNDQAQKRINIIGEPILKKQLQKMLDSKRIEKIDRIDQIEQDIKKLSDELESLKNDKN